MSTCDRCAVPGFCCRQFILNGGHWGRNGTMLELMGWLAQAGMPFIPLHRRRNGVWTFVCPNLGRDGRCTDYDRRPELCRVFDPAEDPLCVHFGPAEGTDGPIDAIYDGEAWAHEQSVQTEAIPTGTHDHDH